MIGLGFLAAGLLWLAVSWYLASRLPKWLGIARPIWRLVVGAIVLLVLLVGPFVDHFVGMQQFERLCASDTGLWVSPKAAQTKRGKGLSSQREPLHGYVIPISRQKSSIVDLDTSEVIARYSYFASPGGSVGPLLRLGGEYTCSVEQPWHADHQRFLSLKAQVGLTYGDPK